MSDFGDSLIESDCNPLLNHCSGVFTVRYDSHSGVSILRCKCKSQILNDS